MKATFGGGNLGLPQFDPYNIERIDVVRGPTSTLYGQGYPGGMINMITKRPTEQKLREVSAGLGDDGRMFETFDFSGPVDEQGRFLYRLTGVGRKAGGQVDFVEEERFAIAPSFTFRPQEGTSLTLLASYQKDPKGGYYGSLPEAGTLTPLADGGYISRSFFPGDPDFDKFERKQASIGYLFEHRFDNGWKINHSLRYIDTNAQIHALASAGLMPPTTLMRMAMFGDSDTRSLTSDSNIQGKVETGPLTHNLLLGLDHAQSNWRQDLGINLAGVPSIDIRNPDYGQTISAPDSPATAMVFSSTTEKLRQTGFYAQDRIEWGGWKLALGGRYDRAKLSNDRTSSVIGMDTSGVSSESYDAFSGKASLAYVFGNGVTLYGGYSTSFVPTPGLDAAGNAFRPISGKQWEAGAKYAPSWFNGYFAASAFDIRLEDALTVDTDPTHFCVGQMGPGACQVQTGEQRFRGLELEARAELGNGFSAIGAYTWLDAATTKSNSPDLGKRPVNTPQHMASFWLGHEFQQDALLGLTLGAGVRYVGSTYGDSINAVSVPGYTLADASLQYDFGKKFANLDGLKLNINATNLFDKTFVACSGSNFCNFGAGRSVTGKLAYSW